MRIDLRKVGDIEKDEWNIYLDWMGSAVVVSGVENGLLTEARDFLYQPAGAEYLKVRVT